MGVRETVLSVPAGKSYRLITQALIYSCPAAYTYKDKSLITFRTAPPAVRMANIYRIQQVITADPTDIPGTCDAESAVCDKIAAYVQAANHLGVLAKPGKYRFYLLDPHKVIPLPHAPRTSNPCKGPLYFDLPDLLSGNPFVNPLGPLTYREKLLDQRWIEKRELIKTKRKGQCELCGCQKHLDVHHGYYSPFLEPWEYNDETLWVLCRSCHEETQRLLTSIHMVIGSTHPRLLQQLKSRIKDAAFEESVGISVEEAERLVHAERHIRSTLYSDYLVEITKCSDLGPSIASELEALATLEFSGVEVSIVENDRDGDGDGAAYVSGPNPEIVDQIQAIFDWEREKRG